jgi:hypothetical protein
MIFKNPWFYVFLVLCIASIAGVIYGVVVVSATEPGEMPVATPEMTSGTPSVPEWVSYSGEDFPLTVEAYEYAAASARLSDARTMAVDTAMGRINERVGFTVFRWALDTEDADVEITLNGPVEVGTDHSIEADTSSGGSAGFVRTGRLGFTCTIRTTNIAGTGMEDLVLQHELGHCLLLDHDCSDSSIMCGGSCCTLAPTPDRVLPPWLSDRDRDLIRERYGS